MSKYVLIFVFPLILSGCSFVENGEKTNNVAERRTGTVDIERNLVFHFNFRNAAGKREIKDLTGRFRCVSKNNDFVVQRHALRTAPVSKIYIPSDKLPNISEKVTVSAWIFKRATPDATPILMKGEHPEPIEFLFSIGWRYPVFCYKNLSRQDFWKGVYYSGDFGTRIYYGKKDFLVNGNNLIESSGYWRNVTATFELGNVRMYVDGELTAQTTAPTPERLKRNNLPIYIGASRLTGEDLNFKTADMLINDIRLYDRSLSLDEVKAIFDNDKKKYTLTCLIPKGETHLNALSHCDEYPFDKNFDPEFKKKLRITAEYEKKLAKNEIKVEKITSAQVKRIAGTPHLLINKRKIFPMQVLPAFFVHADGKYRWRLGGECEKDFAAAGVDLVGLTGLEHLWKGEGEYDWPQLDALLKIVTDANPNVKLMPYLPASRPPGWFAKRYPGEFELLYRGAHLQKSYTAPLGSRIWLKHSVRMLRDIVAHLESGPYGNHIYGYKVGGGESAEWYWPGGAIGGLGFSGYSNATLKSFREWLRKIYDNDVTKLRNAWNDQMVDFENAKVPSVKKRKRSEKFYFRDPKQAGSVIDFKKFMSDMTFEHIETSTQAVKEACDFKKTVLIYGGYQLNSNSKKLANNGRLANDRVFSCPYIDMLTTPIGYRHRRGGDAGLNVNPFDASATLHNKFIWRENDLRTHFCERIESSRTATMEETITVIQRSFGNALTSGGGLWLYAFNNAWFHQNEVMESISRIQAVAKASLQTDQRSNAEVAFLFDEKSLYYLAYDCGGFMTALGRGVYQNAARMGAPFDVYMLRDITNNKMPDYKMYVFMNAFSVNSSIRKAIKLKTRKNRAVSVWCYAPGYINSEGFSIDDSFALSQIQLREMPGKHQGILKIIECDHPITRVSGVFKKHVIGPWFSVVDSKAKILGTFDGEPALAIKEFSDWRSVYSLTPLTKELLMGLCDYAGVHVYSRTFDVFRANNNYIMLHASTSGAKKIVLPRKSRITEVLTDRVVGKKVLEITETLPAKTTRIYKLGEVDPIKEKLKRR